MCSQVKKSHIDSFTSYCDILPHLKPQPANKRKTTNNEHLSNSKRYTDVDEARAGVLHLVCMASARNTLALALAVALSKLHSPSFCATCRSHRATDWGSMPVLPSSTSGIFLQCTAPHSPPLRIVLRRVPCMHHPLSCFHAPRLELGELSPLRARNPPVSAPQVSKHDETQRSVYTRDVYLADVGDNVVELS